LLSFRLFIVKKTKKTRFLQLISTALVGCTKQSVVDSVRNPITTTFHYVAFLFPFIL